MSLKVWNKGEIVIMKTGFLKRFSRCRCKSWPCCVVTSEYLQGGGRPCGKQSRLNSQWARQERTIKDEQMFGNDRERQTWCYSQTNLSKRGKKKKNKEFDSDGGRDGVRWDDRKQILTCGSVLRYNRDPNHRWSAGLSWSLADHWN